MVINRETVGRKKYITPSELRYQLKLLEDIYLKLTGGTLTGDLTMGDNIKITQGTGSDYSQYFDGTNQNFDLTSGDFKFNGGNVDLGEHDLTATNLAGFFRPVTSADADAPVNSVYYSSDKTDIVYKNAAGTVFRLGTID